MKPLNSARIPGASVVVDRFKLRCTQARKVFAFSTQEKFSKVSLFNSRTGDEIITEAEFERFIELTLNRII